MDAKTLCLGVLARGDASGYEIKKSFEEGPFAHIQAASFGSIYPALNRLSEDGLLTCREEPQDKRPDKKVYSITPAGREALAARLMTPPAPDRVSSDFLFILFFAHLLPTPLLGEFIDQRIAWYEASLARMEGCGVAARPPGERFVHGFGLAWYTAAARYLRAHRDDLLAELNESTSLVAE
ncbi:MAG: PadR family transcriptional regulator [Kiloniellales bacterium]|nr:PadR family transcriptional regulator [Kiloniellales bacterium]